MRGTRLALAFTLAATAAPAAADITPTSDPVLYWNDIAIKTAAGSPPAQARAIAIMNAAVYDAVLRGTNGANTFYNTGVAAPGGDVKAAAAQAAHDVLKALYPANAAQYDAALVTSLSQVSDGTGKTNGIATGTAYATAMLTRRATDGSAVPAPYTPGTNPGEWRPTPPGFAPAAATQYANVTPFLMTSPSQFRPAAPPSLNSPEYLAAYNEVKILGSATSAIRTLDQTNAALFWDASNGTTWNRIGVDMLADDGKSTLENARVMAKLSTGIADSLISGFDSKYTYNFWRPVTAIRLGNVDGDDETEGDPDWSPLFATPAHPSYMSTHSLQSGAASVILRSLIADRPFCNTIAGDTRCFAGLAEAGADAANSRLWGGIHFRFDNEVGLKTGQEIGAWTLAQSAFAAVPEPAAWAMLITGFGLVGAVGRRTARPVARAARA